MVTGNRRGSEPARRRRGPLVVARLVLTGFFAVAASSVPEWRLDPSPRPGVTLVVGAPVLPFPPAGPDGRRTLRD